MILRVTGQRELLARNRVLARSIRLRNPYVDPMSLIQVELLRRKQQGQQSSDLEYPLGATINGIAAGLHNTGIDHKICFLCDLSVVRELPSLIQAFRLLTSNVRLRLFLTCSWRLCARIRAEPAP